jgi:hypothetical protein
MVEIFLFIIAAGVIAHFIGASVHEGIFVGALVRPATLLCMRSMRFTPGGNDVDVRLHGKLASVVHGCASRSVDPAA